MCLDRSDMRMPTRQKLSKIDREGSHGGREHIEGLVFSSMPSNLPVAETVHLKLKRLPPLTV